MRNLLHKLIPDKIYYFFVDLVHYIPYLLFCIFPIKKNKIYVCSFYDGDYSDNPKYIVEKIIDKYPQYDIVWVIKRSLLQNNSVPNTVRVVESRTFKDKFEMATSAVWIDNSRKLYKVHRRKGQKYIQTWHGAPGIKKCEGDSEEKLSDRYLQQAMRDTKMCTLMISNSEFTDNLFRRAFWYDGEIIRCGSPRNDILCVLPQDIYYKIRNYYNIPYDRKIVLYAPTFRKNDNMDIYNIDVKGCINALSERFGGKWIMIMRLHPNIKDKKFNFDIDTNYMCDASLYPDMQELLVASDCLITDFSSSNIDYILTKRPCFCYAVDLEKYDRGFYFKIEDMPFNYSKTNNDLVESIKNFDYSNYLIRCEKFMSNTKMIDDGNASQRVADIIAYKT